MGALQNVLSAQSSEYNSPEQSVDSEEKRHRNDFSMWREQLQNAGGGQGAKQERNRPPQLTL